MDISSGHHHAQWSASPVDQDAFLAPSLAPVRGMRPIAPPKTCFSHRAISGLPFPIYAVQLPAFFYQDGQIRSSTPPSTHRWKVRWMVLSSPRSLGKWFHWQELRIRKMTPSSIFRWFHPFAPLRLGWVKLQNHRFNSLPQIIG